MKCTKCDSEMERIGFVYINPEFTESDHKFKCSCGNTQYTPMSRIREAKVSMKKDFKKQEFTDIIFRNPNCTEVGRLYILNQKLYFSGNLDDSAQILLKNVCRMFNKNIPE